MDPVVSVQNKNFSGSSQKLAKVLGARKGNQKSFTLTINSLEFGKPCEVLSCTWTPRRLEANGIAERAVRRVKEGTSVVLLQSGLDENWWADSMECYSCLRNIQDLLSDGKTPYERRFGEPFKRTNHSVWFTCLVLSYLCERSVPNPSIWKVLPGMFLGYALHAS